MALFHLLKQRRIRVLFVCLGNSYRSRIAESLANTLGEDVLEARSAGFLPAGRTSRTARQLLEEQGFSLAQAQPRKLTAHDLEWADLVINLCEYGLPKCQAVVLKAEFPDPVRRPEDEQRKIQAAIRRFVETLIVQFRQPRDEWTPTPRHWQTLSSSLTLPRTSSAQLHAAGLPA